MLRGSNLRIVLIMSRDGAEHRRNIFDAFLSFVKVEKGNLSGICCEVSLAMPIPRGRVGQGSMSFLCCTSQKIHDVRNIW